MLNVFFFIINLFSTLDFVQYFFPGFSGKKSKMLDFLRENRWKFLTKKKKNPEIFFLLIPVFFCFLCFLILSHPHSSNKEIYRYYAVSHQRLCPKTWKNNNHTFSNKKIKYNKNITNNMKKLDDKFLTIILKDDKYIMQWKDGWKW